MKSIIGFFSIFFKVGEQLSSLTPHPRFMRFLGTCFNPGSREIWILSDMGAGATLEVGVQQVFATRKLPLV